MANGPLLSKLEVTRQDAAGNPIVGAVITIRRQGATVVSGGPTSFVVDDVGGIVVGDNVNVYNADGTDPISATRSVSSITATNVTVGGPGFTAANNDRISPSVNPAVIFKDANGDEAFGGATITTDTNGYAYAWVFANQYDIVSVGGTSPLGTATTRVWFDVTPGTVGGWRFVNTFLSGTSVTDRIDQTRASVAGHKFIQYRDFTGTERWYVGLNAALAAILPAHNVAGLLTIDSGGLTVTAGTSALQALTATTGSFSGLLSPTVGLTAATGNLKATAGHVIASRAMFTRGTTLATADFSLSAGWGDTATKSVNGAAYDTCGEFRVTANGAGIVANPTVVLTYKDGGFPGAQPPNVIATRSDAAAPTTAYWIISARTVSTFTAAFIGTPVAGNQYNLQWFTVGGEAS